MASQTIAALARYQATITIQASFWELAGLGSALVLAFVFSWAALAKLRDQTNTIADFASLGLPRPRLLATVVPALEIMVAILLALWPGWGGVAAFTLLVVFTTVLATIIKSGVTAACACFGGTSSHPIGIRHLLRNGGLLCLAIAATTVGPWLGDLISWV